jgi:hypothetical protein
MFVFISHGLRAARLLLIDREALPREVTDALYAESPDLRARHGLAVLAS